LADASGGGDRESLLARVVDLFLRGSLPPLLIAISLVAGLVALVETPREEEPQIVVPMADVHVSAPGLPVGEVDRQIATRLEKLLSQIDGVEHVYSMSLPGRAVVTVRFFVGEDREDSRLDVYDKIHSNTDLIPPAVTDWVVKPVEIDDVPIVIATLWSERPESIDDHALRRVAEELEIELQAVPETNRVEVFGGRPRVVRVELDPDALAARQTSALEVAWALEVSNVRRAGGGFDRHDVFALVDAGDFLGGVGALRRMVVNVVDGVPVRLGEVARVRDGPAERETYGWIGFGAGESERADLARHSAFLPAVHVAVAKQRGSNAVTVAERVEQRIAALAPTLLPEGVHVRITRNHGETADEKVNELLEALAVAILIVIALIAYSLGWREGLIVAVTVPITFALTLLLNDWAGYTINRVTLFALILSLGLVVDDPIVDVENIYRHLRMRAEPPLEAVRNAVNEVRPPIILSTLVVIASFLPMAFITGMMGPYMRPMALNVPVAVVMSTVVALTITPWLAWRALKGGALANEDAKRPTPVEETATHRFYERLLGGFLDDGRRAWALFGTVSVLFAAAVGLVALRAIPLKMLPFDNKNELQLLVDAPEGTTLERTDATVRRLAEVIRRAPEVRDFEVYTGFASPMDFNGLVRHYFLRRDPHMAEIRVNLVPKRRREMQSHELALRLRSELEAIADEAGVRIALVEVPPGPPVLATLTAEVSAGPTVPYERIRAAARALEARLTREPGVRDVDSTVEDDAPRLLFVTDQEKAALSGVAVADVAETLELALAGRDASQLHVEGEANPLPIRLRLPRSTRSGEGPLLALSVKGRPGIVRERDGEGVRDAPIPIARLGELGRFEAVGAEKAIYRKDLRRVAYVYAEPVGRAPAEIAADVAADLRPATDMVSAEDVPRPLAGRTYLANGGGLPWSLPEGTMVDWLGEGELDITVDVFRDLGIAFGVALLGIYAILVYQTGSKAMPLILMISIPLTLIGIMPGFWVLSMLSGEPIGGFANPTFFTATAMIGMIALSGIAVRNAILLIEFLHVELRRGRGLREAILQAGTVRTRPILLTAGTAMLAAIPITLDPIFSGLAWALIFGLLVSTAFTLVVVPVAYYRVYRDRPGHGVKDSRRRDSA
jgi:multidrug efflux pump subunit AcrB